MIKIGDMIQIVNPNSSFCGKKGIATRVGTTALHVLFPDDQNYELEFYIFEVQRVDVTY